MVVEYYYIMTLFLLDISVVIKKVFIRTIEL